MTTALSIAPGLLRLITEHCIQQQPNEACGFLLGHDHDVLFVMPMPNSSREPSSQFYVSPEDAARAIHRSIDLGVQVIGAWHSHPNGPDLLSHADRAASPDPAFLHLLIGRGESVQAFRVLAPTRVLDVPVRLRHGGHPDAPDHADLAARTGHSVRERARSQP